MTSPRRSGDGHTPGPWHVEHHIHVKAENGWRVATVNVPSGSVGSWGIAPQDNARLIAAAPELKAAGEALLAEAERHIFGDECKAEREAMRAAIAKATGKATP